MKYIVIAVATITLVTLSGCQKLLDYYDVEGKKPKPPCTLTKVITGDVAGSGDPYTINYQYDALGRPISFEDNEDPAVSNAEWFEYDDLGRLSTHTTRYYFTEISKYVYEGNTNKPLRDTLIDFADRIYIETFSYDDLGRIIRVEKKFHFAPEWYPWELYGDPLEAERVVEYFYDIRGNRQEFGSLLKYSEIPSDYSLHWVWQLVNRNYSKNWPEGSGADSFNEYGLPLTFEKSGLVREYSCE